MTEQSQASESTKEPVQSARSIIKDFCKEAREKQLARHKKRLKATPPPPKYAKKAVDGEFTGPLSLEPEDFFALMDACGTTDHAFAEALVHDLNEATRHATSKRDGSVLNAGLTALSGIAPTDEIESMLATQMFATHKAAMNLLGLAIRAEALPVAQWQSGFAIKLLRTYAMQVEALQRYRGKGQQKVTVEHVHVHAGGQAIVGSVTGGGGGQEKTEKQPHAIESQPTITMPAMPCPNAEGRLMHVSGDAERQVPDARRPIDRRAERK